jgi:hypothetical protein
MLFFSIGAFQIPLEYMTVFDHFSKFSSFL